MGEFDDALYDADVVERLGDIVKEFVDYDAPAGDLDAPPEETLRAWEAEVCYSGYSVAYHSLRPAMIAMVRCPLRPPLPLPARSLPALDNQTPPDAGNGRGE